MARIVLITGANRGIGRELAAQLAADGDTVLLTARHKQKAVRAAREIGGDVHPIQLDTSDQTSIDAASAKVEAGHGQVDVLVNNVGGLFSYDQRPSDVDLAHVQDALGLNLFGKWRTTQVFLPLVRKSDNGRIVNVSSEAGSITRVGPYTSAYSVSKAALNSFTAALAAELKDEGITVHAASPGWTATDLGGEGGRLVPEGAASIKHVVNLPVNAGTGGFYQDGKLIPW
ncbi:SDR family NAD(P)-dependent oxidoreductase [Brevibacterium yomogidense]|uniref:SDR family NAD(P)-dependent oxidoreductase n=1 Tax=Brevibacterium yomogidense TaxID=946573 RepID=UPI0018DF8291|nr:SDR family NAD(P)-dependent oxidoreductase [Brevibacterium yomogidense]